MRWLAPAWLERTDSISPQQHQPAGEGPADRREKMDREINGLGHVGIEHQIPTSKQGSRSQSRWPTACHKEICAGSKKWQGEQKP
jgi:hypothetical protein